MRNVMRKLLESEDRGGPSMIEPVKRVTYKSGRYINEHHMAIGGETQSDPIPNTHLAQSGSRSPQQNHLYLTLVDNSI